jgi:uncharacterized protein (DUF305 family)
METTTARSVPAETPEDTAGAPPSTRAGVPFVLATVVVVALLAGLVLGRSTADAGDELDPVSVGFLQDMSTHHAQAVAMSAVAHRRVSEPDLNYLAEDILTTQQGQIGIMSAWLRDAEAPQTNPGEVMAWMGAAHAGHMPGMATATELEQLTTLPLPQAEEQYLRLMVRHHAGAVPMAAYAASHADDEGVAGLARDMELGQTSEIDALNAQLVARGLAPEPVAADAVAGGTSAPGAPGPSDGHTGHGG